MEKEKIFTNGCTSDMTSEDILNWYRNFYHTESELTEHGIITKAINDILPKYTKLKSKRYNLLDIKCPYCGKTLQIMNISHKLVDTERRLNLLCWCEHCKDGIDSEWNVIYTKEDGIKEIKRHFWG